MTGLSIIVFTYNSEPLIRETLDCIDRALAPVRIPHEIIIVDNNSTDRTVEVVRDCAAGQGREIRIILNEIQGLVYSRIAGVKAARFEYVCFIDDDNRLHPEWFQVLLRIIEEHRPDVIGGRSVGVTTGSFPRWWEKYEGSYACGTRHAVTGFLDDPLKKFWGAGFTARTSYLLEALTAMEPLCVGRSGRQQTSGEDAEINYRLRMLGARFYHSLDLVLDHYMKPQRLRWSWLRSTFRGNAQALIYLETYKQLITGRRWYDLRIQALVFLLAAPYLSLRFKINYFPYAWIRLVTLCKRLELQKSLATTFQPFAEQTLSEQAP